MDAMIIPILHLGKQRHREAEGLALGYYTCKEVQPGFEPRPRSCNIIKPRHYAEDEAKPNTGYNVKQKYYVTSSAGSISQIMAKTTNLALAFEVHLCGCFIRSLPAHLLGL